jgi:hypothetical protein
MFWLHARTNEIEQSYWMKATNWTDPWPLDEGERPKSGKIEAKPTWHHFGVKINWFEPKKKRKKKSPKGELMIWRTKM